MGKTSWQATRQNQIKVLKTLFMPSCLWVEARDEQTRFENCVRIAKSPSSLCPRKSRPATERERERARARKGTEGAGTKLVHCVVDHDDHFVDIMRQLAEPQPQPQPQP